MTTDLALSKTIAHALRHDPYAYGLDPDEHGWVSLPALLDALRTRSWPALSAAQVADLAAADAKGRYEVAGDRVRARYGHSFALQVRHATVAPPSRLLHGTTQEAAARILTEGLRPMRRQYVHLSTDAATARTVASRHRGRVVLLAVDAAAAAAAGVLFHHPSQSTWLSGPIAAQHLSVLDGDPTAHG